MGLVDDEICIYYGNEDVSVSMASAKMRDILEYIHKCPEIQCPEEYCRWFEENRDLSNDPKKGDIRLKRTSINIYFLRIICVPFMIT